MTTVGIVSDLHLPSKNHHKYDALKSVLTELSTHQLDTLVLLGDIVHTHTTASDSELLSEVSNLSTVDTTVLLGNHDIDTLSKEEATRALPNNPFGSFSLGEELMGVYLDTSDSRLGTGGYIEEEDLDFLKTRLQSEENIVLFTHHPVKYYNTSDSEWFGKHPELALCSNKWRVEQLIEEYPDTIVACINGHLHGEFEQMGQYPPAVTVNAFNLEPEPEHYSEKDLYNYSVVDIDAQGGTYREYRWNTELEMGELQRHLSIPSEEPI